MFIAGFPAAALGTNCYVVSAEGPGGQCVVIDPGVGVARQLGDLLTEHGLRPAAVVLTHGHFDHVFSVASVCATYDVPAYLHPADVGLLKDPTMGLPISLEQLTGGRQVYVEPDGVRPLIDGARVEVAGLELIVDHVPGHTGGSVLLRIPGGETEPVCFSGDVLFAGSIGRTDLPGGDPAAMTDSLRDRVLSLDDATIVLPGHGESTTIGRERVGNPFLTGLGRHDARRTGF